MALFRRLQPAILVAATGVVLVSLFGNLATASGGPREWDIEWFDTCIKTYVKSDDPSERTAQIRKCCLDSGGDWNDSLGQCVAPPCGSDCGSAEGSGWAPPGGWPDKLPTHTFQPAEPAPPVNVPPTLAPANPG